MVDLYGAAVGQPIRLPFAGQTFVVAGIWRDYARQSGAIQMRLEDYQRLTGDLIVTDAALWLAANVDPAKLKTTMQSLPFGADLDFAAAGEIRALSLKIFDRSFAVTYLLELVAILTPHLLVVVAILVQKTLRILELVAILVQKTLK